MLYKNNPLNIRYSSCNKWLGQCGENNGFCEFTNLCYGVRAAGYLLMHSYRKAGCKTYAQLITRFAPASDNNPTQNYISYICGCLHVFPFDEPKTLGNFAGLIHFMWKFEQGKDSRPFNARWIFDVFVRFDLKVYGSKC